MGAGMGSREVAALEERRVAVGVGELAKERLEWCGGVACYGGAGSWSSQALGCCMDGEVATAEGVAALAAWYESRGCEPKVVVCPFADGSLVRELGEAGFRLKEFEMVFACAPGGGEGAAWRVPEGVEFVALDARDDGVVEEAARLATSIYHRGEGEAPEALRESFAGMLRHPRMRTILVRAGDELVAVSSVEVSGEIGALCGAAVRESHRRRGIQGALIGARLEMAWESGCRVVTVTSLPGVGTERNAVRWGFSPSYTKVAMVRVGEGLVGSR